MAVLTNFNLKNLSSIQKNFAAAVFIVLCAAIAWQANRMVRMENTSQKYTQRYVDMRDSLWKDRYSETVRDKNAQIEYLKSELSRCREQNK